MQRSCVYYKCPNCGQEMQRLLGGRPIKTPVKNTKAKTLCSGCGHEMIKTGEQDIPEIRK